MEISLVLHWTIVENLHKSFPQWLFHIVSWDICSRINHFRNSVTGEITEQVSFMTPVTSETSSLILSADEVDPLRNVLLDGTELLALSVLSLLQMGHESSQLLLPLVS